jgi:serine protease Do
VNRLAPGIALCVGALAVAPAAAQSALHERQQQVFREALRAVRPAIVRIDTIGGVQPANQSRDREGAGRQAAARGFRQADGPTTGLIWSADGYIVTSSFNFIRDPSIITVKLSDGRRFVARLIARDHPARLALLKVEATGLPTPRLRAPGQSRPGQWALAAGCGHASEDPALAVGVVSALDRMSGLAVQTDAKVSPANYGGPLFDIEGRVIGICVPMGPGEDEIADAQWYDSGIGFAVTTDVINSRLPRLKEGRDLKRGLMGISLDARAPVVGMVAKDPADELPTDGLRINAEPLGPAAEAGLTEGDVIIRLDDAPVPRLVDLRRALARKVAGDQLAVTYRRGGEISTATLTLTSERAFREPAADPP